MATISKKICKFQPPDWFLHSASMSWNSLRQREASYDIRQETRSLRLSTELKSKWDNYYNSSALSDRLDTVLCYKDILEFARSMLDEEIAQLSSSKEALEKEITGLQIPQDCNLECLTLRDRRRGVDFTEGKPDCELRMEQELLNKCRIRLQHKVDESFDQLLLLQEARQQVLKDLQDKNDAIEIDIEQNKLTKNCSGVSLKFNSTRVPKGTTTLQQWEDFTKYNFQRAEAEISASRRLRESIFHTLRETENELGAQGRSVDFALRQRVHEDEQALDELKWQLQKTEKEMDDMINDLDKVELELQSEMQNRKVAETRLERRTYRPGVELCRDGPQYSLTDEVNQLETSRQALLLKQWECRHQLDMLELNRVRLKAEIAVKENSFYLDTNCLESRRIRSHGVGRLGNREERDCLKLMAGHPTKDELICEEASLKKVPTFSKLDPVTSSCAL